MASAAERGDMSLMCLPVTVYSDKPQSPQSLGSLSSQGGGFSCEPVNGCLEGATTNAQPLLQL